MVAVKDFSGLASVDMAGTACKRDRDLGTKQAIQMAIQEVKMCNKEPSQVDEEANAGEWCTSGQKRSRSQMAKAGKNKTMADGEIKQVLQDAIQMLTPQSKTKEKKVRGQSKVRQRSGADEEVPFGVKLWENAVSLSEEMSAKDAQAEGDANAGEWCTAGQKRSRSKSTRAGKNKAKPEAEEPEQMQPAAAKHPQRARSRPANQRKEVEAPTPEKTSQPKDQSNAKQEEDVDEVDEEKQVARREEAEREAREAQLKEEQAEREARAAQLKEEYALKCLERELQAATAAIKASPENDEDLDGWEVL